MKRIAVIGGGPAGVTCAYELARQGCYVELYEADERVGGMAKTIDLWGQRVDLGPHRFFSSDVRINRLWLSIMGDDYKMVDRLTRIYYRGKFFQYPIQIGDALSKLGMLGALKSGFSFARQLFFPTSRHPGTFEWWVVRKFGRHLFNTFFKSYSEKLWGISCTELDADFAAQRIKKMSLFGAVWNAVRGGRNNKHKTLVDRFAYPLGGTGEPYERMAEQIRQWGGVVRLSSPIDKLILDDDNRSGVVPRGGTVQYYDHVVSTMPLTQMVSSLGNLPVEVSDAIQSLRFRNTILVYLQVDGEDLFPDNWLYIHEPALRVGRITNFRNWVPELNCGKRETILCLEYWCNFEDSLWSSQDEELVTIASREIVKTGLTRGAKILSGKVIRVPRCYPVYAMGYASKVKTVSDFLRKFRNLSAIGRYGSFKYNNQDHSILMGLLCAENIVSNANHDLWSINTDYETYQEQAVITETGLQLQPAHA